ncbi:hypothetical protein PEX1_099600 [Penicillium expansum]|uniref:Uncharacterized protein n=1 Tax=Penicillium expansum TaxID=27334 RepID=A0A0A2KQH5_PENEN|nr:hypothetical protein PEX2_064240 [Penicillium expansum]KGO43796.1 hypothetical protein PEXP_093670 [Penicillium expansum]KGO51962.1 hypothetical protein PEX2_064240 [Penicillium expansum]KGO70097.1 hypothetical protein PEX1_099600 [Penicillium expansum]
MPYKNKKSEADNQSELEQGTNRVLGIDRPETQVEKRCWGTVILAVVLFISFNTQHRVKFPPE